MKFAKMHALGNDFMVIEAITQNVFLNSKTIQALADRNRGVGFDQLLLIEPPYDPDTDFHYRIFNADGSEVSQCGNGARCFATFVSHKQLTNKNKIHVTTNNGRMILEILNDGNVKVNMGVPNFNPSAVPFIAKKQELNYLITTEQGTQFCGVVSMGNPHAVIVVDDIAKAPVKTVGPLVETHERFPEKTNVPFIQVISPTEVKVRVWERGAGETQACGSGCCGAVAVAIKQGVLSAEQPVLVHTLGGDLVIQWTGKDTDPLFMSGPTSYVFAGEIDQNTMKNIRNSYYEYLEKGSKLV